MNLGTAFPGLLFAGDGSRLAGDRPNFFAPELSAQLPFKTVVCNAMTTLDGDMLELADRVWVLPERFNAAEEPPVFVLCHLAGVVRAGRKVGLASADELTCLQMRDLLMLALADAQGQA